MISACVQRWLPIAMICALMISSAVFADIDPAGKAISLESNIVMARELYGQDKWTEAAPLLEKIVASAQAAEVADAKRTLVECYRKLKQYDKTAKLYEDLLAVYPNEREQWYYMMGEDLSAQGKYSQALKAFQEATKRVVELGITPSWQYRSMGDCYMHIDHKRALDRFLDKTLVERPDMWVEAAYPVACELIDQKIDIEKGVSLLKNVPILVPTHSFSKEARARLAAYYREQQDWANTEQVCREIATHYPEEESQWLNQIGRDLMSQSRYAEAIPVFEEVRSDLSNEGNAFGASLDAATCWMICDPVVGLEQYLATLRQENPNWWGDACFRAGAVMAERGSVEKGVALIDRFIKEMPAHPAAKFAQIEIVQFKLMVEHEPVEARQILDELQTQPDWNADELSYYQAHCSAIARNYPEAIVAFQTLSDTCTDQRFKPAAKYGIADCYALMNNVKAYRNALEAVIKEFPDTSFASDASRRLNELLAGESTDAKVEQPDGR